MKIFDESLQSLRDLKEILVTSHKNSIKQVQDLAQEVTNSEREVEDATTDYNIAIKAAKQDFEDRVVKLNTRRDMRINAAKNKAAQADAVITQQQALQMNIEEKINEVEALIKQAEEAAGSSKSE